MTPSTGFSLFNLHFKAVSDLRGVDDIEHGSIVGVTDTRTTILVTQVTSYSHHHGSWSRHHIGFPIRFGIHVTIY